MGRAKLHLKALEKAYIGYRKEAFRNGNRGTTSFWDTKVKEVVAFAKSLESEDKDED